MNLHEFELFLKSAKHLLDEETLIKNERFRRGEDFNIFEVMGMESDEVFTHSAILACLLDPNGSHGCGDVFLKLFLSSLLIFSDWNFSTKNAKTQVEYSIGPILKSREEGGRIDILLESDQKGIIIENKIYACDFI